MMARNGPTVTSTLARRSGDPDAIANAGAVALLNNAAQMVLDAAMLLGGMDHCPRHVYDAFYSVTKSLDELP